MLAYSTALQFLKFRAHYKMVSNLQRYDEEVTKQRFCAAAHLSLGGNGDADEQPLASSHLAWDLLQSATAFPVLDDLCRRGEQYEMRFVASCRTLAARLETAKARSLSGPPSPPLVKSRDWPDDRRLAESVEDKAKQIADTCTKLARMIPNGEAVPPPLSEPVPDLFD